MKDKGGKPTTLTDELVLAIRKQVLDGVKYIDIQDKLEIPANTWDAWVYKDYTSNPNKNKGFRTLLNEWKNERLIRKTEKLSDEILDANHIKEDGKYDTDLLRVKQKEAEFVRETLGKLNYSKKTETDLTSKGESINPVLVKFINGAE